MTRPLSDHAQGGRAQAGIYLKRGCWSRLNARSRKALHARQDVVARFLRPLTKKKRSLPGLI